jgi:hypothetical protein
VSLSPFRVGVSLLAILLCALALAGCGSNAASTPTHVAAIYIDAVNHGDFRAACQQIQPAVVKHLWGSFTACQSYFTSAFSFVASYKGLGGYKIVPHSYRGWREGDARVARVLMTPPYGDLLRVRLVKTAHGWKIAGVS